LEVAFSKAAVSAVRIDAERHLYVGDRDIGTLWRCQQRKSAWAHETASLRCRCAPMAGIAHLSDIHFGAHDPRIVAATEAWLQARQPDLVIISGDFTQRARIGQFREASAYVNRLRAAGHNLLVVPGNHDVPLYDVVRRFAAPLRRYKRFISNDLCPWFENDEISVLGINTARSLTIKDGRINHEQIALMKQRFAAVGASKTRILVTHHPLFSMPIGAGGELSEAVGRHEEAVEGACEAGVHLALAGHFHRTYAEAARKMAERAGSAIIIQAGTATSTRLRNAEPQSFNWLEVRRNDHFSLQVIAWNGTSFSEGDKVAFAYDGGEWHSNREHKA
jgi:3',5'-cyclic AMP phosphodiesterase CpdA